MTQVSSKLACLLALLGACTFAASDRPISNSCGRDRDCGSGEMCDKELARCVSERKAGYDVVLRVTATASEFGPGAPPTRFGPISLDDSVIERDLRVQNITPLRGLVAIAPAEDPETRTPIAVELLLTPTKVSAGPPPQTLAVMSLASTGEPDDPNFATSLRGGVDYTLIVKPVGEAVSRVPPRSLVLTAEEIAEGFVEILYDQLEEVKGRLLTVEGVGQGGLSVRVIDADGEPLSSRAVSDELGQFSVMLDGPWDRDAEWSLEIGPSSVTPWFGRWVAGHDDMAVLDDNRLVVGLPEIPARVRVEGSVERKDTLERIGAARATFVSEVQLRRRDGTLTTLQVQRTVESEAAGTVETPVGRLEVELWPGEYDVLVTPPSDAADLSSLHQDGFQVVAQPPGLSQKGATFSLPRRKNYAGFVRDGDGRAFAEVVARSVPLEPDDELPEIAAQNRGATVTTSESGAYRLPVDVGRYDLVFEPGAGSGYPWWVETDTRTPANAPPSRGLDIDLMAPVVLSGKVEFDNDRLPAGAVINAFCAVTDASGQERYVQIGSAATREDGSYRLYLPPVQPGSE